MWSKSRKPFIALEMPEEEQVGRMVGCEERPEAECIPMGGSFASDLTEIRIDVPERIIEVPQSRNQSGLHRGFEYSDRRISFSKLAAQTRGYCGDIFQCFTFSFWNLIGNVRGGVPRHKW
jgi:hypothetical protein